MLRDITVHLTSFLIVLVSYESSGVRARAPESTQEITYVSTDLGYAAVFLKDRARIGPDLAIYEALWPSSPARYFETSDNVQCVSIGSAYGTVEYAIKRPIVLGDHYECLKTSFKVVRCFRGCQSAVIERKYPLGGAARRGSIKSYLYIDRCFGMLAFSQNKNLTKGIPLDAPWLRGDVGILAAKEYPRCALL